MKHCVRRTVVSKVISLILINVSLVSVSSPLTGVPLNSQVNRTIKWVLNTHKINYDQLPGSIQKKIAALEDDIASTLSAQMNKEVSSQEMIHAVSAMAHESLKHIIKQAPSWVKQEQLDQYIDECVTNLFNKSDIDSTLIPTELSQECRQHKKFVRQAINQIMQHNGVDYALDKDVRRVVNQKFDTFITRVQYALLWKCVSIKLDELKQQGRSEASSCLFDAQETKKLSTMMNHFKTKKS